jgi:hypothetical protein
MEGTWSKIVIGELWVFVVKTFIEIAGFTKIMHKLQSRIREAWFAVFEIVGSWIYEHVNKIIMI